MKEFLGNMSWAVATSLENFKENLVSQFKTLNRDTHGSQSFKHSVNALVEYLRRKCRSENKGKYCNSLENEVNETIVELEALIEKHVPKAHRANLKCVIKQLRNHVIAHETLRSSEGTGRLPIEVKEEPVIPEEADGHQDRGHHSRPAEDSEVSTTADSPPPKRIRKRDSVNGQIQQMKASNAFPTTTPFGTYKSLDMQLQQGTFEGLSAKEQKDKLLQIIDDIGKLKGRNKSRKTLRRFGLLQRLFNNNVRKNLSHGLDHQQYSTLYMKVFGRTLFYDVAILCHNAQTEKVPSFLKKKLPSLQTANDKGCICGKNCQHFG